LKESLTDCFSKPSRGFPAASKALAKVLFWQSTTMLSLAWKGIF